MNDKPAGESLTSKAYTDLVHPAAANVGETIGRMVRAALLPANAVVWTIEQAADWAATAVQERVARRRTKVHNIQAPNPEVHAAVLIGLQAAGPSAEEDLRTLFANLLATAMDRITADAAHPAFAEIIRQLTAAEARILNLFTADHFPPFRRDVFPQNDNFDEHNYTGYVRLIRDQDFAKSCGAHPPHRVEAFLDNLRRLGLINLREEIGDIALPWGGIDKAKSNGRFDPDPDERFGPPDAGPRDFEELQALLAKPVSVREVNLELTEFGHWFWAAAVSEHGPKRSPRDE